MTPEASIARWRKTGCVYSPKGELPWARSHAQVPVVDPVDAGRLRVYFGTRDEHNQTVTTFVDVESEAPHRVLYVHDRPVLGLGELGCFDDSGAMPTWIVNHGGLKYLYYIGWNASVLVPYRNALGLAVSDDGGMTFRRAYSGPIVDRTATEPHFCGASCILVDQGVWRMWYQTGVRWVRVDGKAEPVYHIRYAESPDGVSWRRPGVVGIERLDADEGGLTRPSVLRTKDGYRMWYSRRAVSEFRTDPTRSYRIGYAESADGVTWRRLDDRAGIDVSTEGWDSQMITYPHVYRHGGQTQMMYNGNGFGRSGFGHAILEDNS